MKLLKVLLPLAFLFCMEGCIEINEQIDVKSNGSGVWVIKTDMGQLLDLMQTYVGKDEMEKQLPKGKMDTTVYFRNIVDTMTSVSAEKKALVKDGRINMKMDLQEKIFNTNMTFPFKSLDNLQQLYSSVGDGSLGTGNLLKGIGPGKSDSSNAMSMPGGGNMPTPDISQFNNVYDFKSKDGLLSRKVNADKFKALQDNPQFSQMKEVTNVGMEVPYTITITLPRPVKKIDNSIAKLSEDKKTVTIKYNLLEMFDHPEKFEYSIAY